MGHPRRLLPAVPSAEAMRTAIADEALWPGALEAIRERHGLTPGRLERAERGSFAVFFLGDGLVVKLVPARSHPQYLAERVMLPHLFGRLTVPTPELVASGDLDGWGYLVMTRLEGAPLGEVWSRVSSEERRDLIRQVGQLMAGVHALPVEGLEPLALDWPRFLEAQRASSATRHARSGADPRWVAGIGPFLEGVLPGILGGRKRVPLTSDFTDEHVLVTGQKGSLRISGLFDFGDALVGDPLYDFVSPATFIVRGDRTLLGALLDGYGIPPQGRTPELRRRLMAFELLHRFGELRRDVDRLQPAHPLPSLEAVEEVLWPL